MASTRAFEKMLFSYGTTYITDFRENEITGKKYTTVVKERNVPPKPPYKPASYVHTICSWKKQAPFSLYHNKPKEIVRENPYDVQQKCEPTTTDSETKKEIIKTRPRLVISPALCLDDIEDPNTRDLITNDVYMSTVMKANNEIGNEYFAVRPPFPGLPAPANPIYAPPYKVSKVPEEWRMESLSWDDKQLRGYCTPTESFWLNQKLPPCKSCEETKIVTDHRLEELKNKAK